jgi:hypothetical protein
MGEGRGEGRAIWGGPVLFLTTADGGRTLAAMRSDALLYSPRHFFSLSRGARVCGTVGVVGIGARSYVFAHTSIDHRGSTSVPGTRYAPGPDNTYVRTSHCDVLDKLWQAPRSASAPGSHVASCSSCGLVLQL